METLRAVWAIIAAVWNTGNRLARWAIVIIALWPFLLVVVALAGIPLLTSLLALLPIVALLLLILASLDPLIIMAIGAFPQGRVCLRWIATIIGTELIVGVYLSVVPVWQDRGLVPLLVLIITAVLFFSIGIQGKWVKKAVGILILIAIAITIIFTLGGREKIEQKIKEREIKWSRQQATAVAQQEQLPICTGGEYDFSTAEIPGEIAVDFQTGCISQVTLPPRVVFRTDPSADVKIKFIDGSEYIDGPKKQVWYGLKKGIFKVRGLSEAGTMKITLEKKS